MDSKPKTTDLDTYNWLEDRFLRYVDSGDSLFGVEIHELFRRVSIELDDKIAASNKALLLRVREGMPEKRDTKGFLTLEGQFENNPRAEGYNTALTKALAVIDAEIEKGE